MKNRFLKIISSFLSVLLLVSCTSGVDVSSEIEKDVATVFSEKNVASKFIAPEIFTDCELSENVDIQAVESDANAVKVIVLGDVESKITKLSYTDIEIRIWDKIQSDNNNVTSEYSLEEYVELWSSSVDVGFTKYTVEGEDYYITVGTSGLGTYFNLLCMNGDYYTFTSGKLNTTGEVDSKTEKKICKDFSIQA